MEIALLVIQLLTAFTGLATAVVKLCIQSTEQKSALADKEGSDAGTAEPHSKNGTAR